MSVHFELVEIPVPDHAKSDGNRVYVNVDNGNGRYTKAYIGLYARKDLGTFYPNDKFRYYYPGLWEKHYGAKDVHPHTLDIGLYSIVLAITHKTGLYDILYSCFGPLYGNAVLDFAMYSIKERSNVANLFKPAMSSSALFSKDRNDDDWYSRLFCENITSTMIHHFKEEWIRQCKAAGVKKVWIAIDGSNSNCEADTTLAQEGRAKSHENKTIVSYIWAINADDGTPVTFFTNEGSTVDSKAFAEICAFITGFGLIIAGFILDRGFLTHDVLHMITKEGYDYVVKLKSDTIALMTMFEKYWQLVYWNPEQLIGKGARFGVVTSEPVKLFGSYNDKAYAGLYFDGKNGSERRVTLIDKMFEAMEKVKEQIAIGEQPVIDSTMSRYLYLEELPEPEKIKEAEVKKDEEEKKEEYPVNGSEWVFEYDKKKYRIATKKENCENDLRLKGIDGLASSRKMTAREMDEVYNLRDVSEKQYMISKSMLGNKVFRAHGTQGIESREAVCFIAAIIRSSFQQACRSVGKKTTRTIEDLDEKAYLLLMPSGNYKFINKMTEGMKALYKKYGLTDKDFETITGDINERMHASGAGVSQYHEMPEDIRKRQRGITDKKKPESIPAIEDKKEEVKPIKSESVKVVAVKEKKKGGRPKGSKNKATLEREAKERALGIIPAPPKPRGRPVGSKDSKPRRRRTKAEIMAADAATAAV